jgi:hypothetical protein
VDAEPLQKGGKKTKQKLDKKLEYKVRRLLIDSFWGLRIENASTK